MDTKDGGIRASMLRESSLTLDQAAMICRNSEITQQHLRQLQKQHNEEEGVSYTRRHRQSGYQPRRDQTDDSDKKETIKEDKISEEVKTRKHLVDTVTGRGNISPQKIVQHGEKDVKSVERKTTLQRFANKDQQLKCTN